MKKPGKTEQHIHEDHEEPLRGSRQSWDFVLENIPDIIMTVAPDNTILEISRTVQGLTVEGTIGKSIYEYIAPEHHDTVRKCLNRVFRTGKPDSYEILGAGNKGPNTAWYETRIFPVTQEGQVVAVTQISTDITARKKANEVLQKSEEKFRLVFESAKDAIFWADAETGLLIKCNRAAELLLEKRRDEIVGKPQTTIHPPDKAQDYASMFRDHIANKTTINDEAEVITKSGRTIPVHITASVTSIAGTSIVQGIFRDISERKRTEQALESAHERLRKLSAKQKKDLSFMDRAAEVSLNGIALSDMEGVLTYANPAFAKLWGYDDPMDVVGKDAATFWETPEKAAHVVAHVRQEGVWSGVIRGEKKDGTCFDARMLVTRVTDEGKSLGLVASFLDVTQEREMQRALKASETRYRQLVENTQDIVYSVDTEGQITFASPAVARYGYSVEEVEGKSIAEFVLPEDLESVHRDFQDTLANGAVMKTRWRMRDKAGGLHHVEELGSPIRAKTGEIVGVTGVLRDVTERIEMEEALRHTSSDLIHAERLATIGQMAAGISHEISQPLTAMRAFTDNTLVFLDRKQYRDVKKNLKTISELLERCVRISRQLKALAYKPPEHPVSVLLETVVDEVVSFLSVRARKEGIEMTTDIPPGDYCVLGDLVRLEQVVMNLISNACDVMRGSEQRKVFLSLSATNESVILRCRDTGPGISDEKLADIFDAFVTTKKMGEGLGLGLAISTRIVEGYGGSLSAANAPEGGAVFTVRLPKPAGS